MINNISKVIEILLYHNIILKFIITKFNSTAIVHHSQDKNINTDVSRALDKLTHRILLTKFSQYGVCSEISGDCTFCCSIRGTLNFSQILSSVTIDIINRL